MNRFSSLLLYTILFTVVMGACEPEFEVDLDQIPIETELKRFDQAFYTIDSINFEQSLIQLQRDFPPFFTAKSEPIFWFNQRWDPQNLELHKQVKVEFGEMETLETELSDLLKRYYYYFGTQDTIQAFTYISRLDYNFPIVFSPPYLFVGLDLYLGERGEEFYQVLPQYLQYHRQKAFLIRDVAYGIAQSKVPPLKEPVSLLDAMIYHGKILKIAERLMEKVPESTLMVFPEQKFEFCLNNEKDMWIYFIENQLLFKTDQDLQRRFIDVAPFSKFRTQIDAETPGRVGRWFGYRIVDTYLQDNPDLEIEDLLRETDSRKILKLSGYKP